MNKGVRHPVEEWIKRIKYKPNVTIFCHANDKMIRLELHLQTQDSRYLGIKPTTILFQQTIDHAMISGFDYFAYWVREQFVKLEDHELCEWFRIDDLMVNDPHAGEKN